MAMALSEIVPLGRRRQMPSIVRQHASANLQMPELPGEAPKYLVAKPAGKFPFISGHRSFTSSCQFEPPTVSTLASQLMCPAGRPSRAVRARNSKKGKVRAAFDTSCPGERRIIENRELSSVDQSIGSCEFRVRIAGQKGSQRKRELSFGDHLEGRGEKRVHLASGSLWRASSAGSTITADSMRSAPIGIDTTQTAGTPQRLAIR